MSFADDFTGAAGAVWNAAKWKDISATSTSITRLDGAGRGELVAQTAAASRVRAAAIMDPIGDLIARYDVSFPTTGEQYHGFMFRGTPGLYGSDGGAKFTTGYSLEALPHEGRLLLLRYIDGVMSELGRFNAATGSPLSVRIQAIGSDIKIRAWPQTNAEPTAWGLERTDSTRLGGTVLAYSFNGAGTNTKTASYDFIQVSAPGSATASARGTVNATLTAPAAPLGTGLWMKMPGGAKVQVPQIKMKTAGSTPTPSASTYRGLNVFGGDAGAPSAGTTTSTFSNNNIGTVGSNYLYDRQASFQFYRNRGHRLARIGFRLERLFSSLNGDGTVTVRTAERDRLLAVADHLAATDMVGLFEPHNYGAFWLFDGTQGVRRDVGSAQFTFDHWANMNRALVDMFAGKAGVIGYDLMNEPALMAAVGSQTSWQRWEQAAQVAYDAIRGRETTLGVPRKWVGVPTYGWSNPWRIVHANSPIHTAGPWITKVSGEDKLIYKVHDYWQTDNLETLTYDNHITRCQNGQTPENRSYTASGGNDAFVVRCLDIAARVQTWLGGEKMWVGEYGIFLNRTSAERAQWINLGDKMLTRWDTYLWWATNWASGEWWGNAIPANFAEPAFEIYYINNPESGAMNTVQFADIAQAIEAHPTF